MVREGIEEIGEKRNDITVHETPMFLTKITEFNEMCPQKRSPKYKMTDFYINQRKKLNILLNDDKPVGGKWTYDSDNRKKYQIILNLLPFLSSKKLNIQKI